MTYLDRIMLKTFKESSEAEKQEIIQAGGIELLKTFSSDDE